MDDLLLAGATGLVGREVARLWVAESFDHGGTLHQLVRRAGSAATGAGLAEVIATDFARLPALPRAAAAICCLGTTIKTAGSAAAFRAVDFDAVIAFARAARAAGVQCFAVVSALGADARSRNLYSRTKGELELALREVGFQRLVIARPSLLVGHRTALNQPPRAGEQVAIALTRPLAWAIPAAWRPIDATVVARALLRAATGAAVHTGSGVLDNTRLKREGRRS